MMALLPTSQLAAQSLEIMPGTQRIFADVQWLKNLDEDQQWSLFSRTRATVDYEQQTNLFSGAYLNYTTRSGFGGSLIGRISSRGGGGDVGIHFFKGKADYMIFAIVSTAIQADWQVAWFSIMRFTPSLNRTWRLYSSLELFSNFNGAGHLASVQRMRLGLKHTHIQFGLAYNLSGLGPDYGIRDVNPGLFVRREF